MPLREDDRRDGFFDGLRIDMFGSASVFKQVVAAHRGLRFHREQLTGEGDGIGDSRKSFVIGLLIEIYPNSNKLSQHLC